MTGIELIAAERARQVLAEGWTPEHDDEHVNSEIGKAAASYARVANAQSSMSMEWAPIQADARLWDWPWSSEWFKPTADPIRNLVKAGALIAAEIDRLQRAKMQEDYSILSGPREAML